MGAYCTPFQNEEKNDFVRRCQATAVKSGRNPTHALHSCEKIWEKSAAAKGEVIKACTPKPNESQNDFISRCMDEKVSGGMNQDEAAGMCHGIWDEKKKADAEVAAKAVEDAFDKTHRVRNVPLKRDVHLAEINEESTGIKAEDLPKSRSFSDFG